MRCESRSLKNGTRFLSGFNIVGDWYPIDWGVVSVPRERGHEISGAVTRCITIARCSQTALSSSDSCRASRRRGSARGRRLQVTCDSSRVSVARRAASRVPHHDADVGSVRAAARRRMHLVAVPHRRRGRAAVHAASGPHPVQPPWPHKRITLDPSDEPDKGVLRTRRMRHAPGSRLPRRTPQRSRRTWSFSTRWPARKVCGTRFRATSPGGGGPAPTVSRYRRSKSAQARSGVRMPTSWHLSGHRRRARRRSVG